LSTKSWHALGSAAKTAQIRFLLCSFKQAGLFDIANGTIKRGKYVNYKVISSSITVLQSVK
jgi:hypothetical protein